MKRSIAVASALSLLSTLPVHISATPLTSNLFKRQPNRTLSDCQNPGANPTPDCWTTLGIDAYIQDWWAKNAASCSAGDFANDGFASCYQQKVGKGSLLNDECDKIGVSNCRPSANFSAYDPREFYVLTSIFGVWQWFNSIYYATDFANGVAAGKIGDIVTTINPVTGDDIGGIVLGVLSSALAFLEVPATAAIAVFSVSKAITAATGTFKTVLQQAPGLTRTLLAPATLSGQFNEKNQIESTLSTVVAAFQANIANGLSAAQRNFTNFLPLVANGGFIARGSDLNASTAVLTRAMTTYITSQALILKGYKVRPLISGNRSCRRGRI